MTLAEDGSYAFKAADFGFADSDTGDALSSVKVATLPAPGKGTLALDGTTASTDQVIAAADLGKLTFEPAANGHGDPYATFTFKVSDGILESASAYTMTVDVTAVNDTATGAPAISGTARKGLTLIASKSTVADADGLTRAERGEAGHAYSWQWIRVDGATETAISAATSKTYTLVAADVGKKIKVRVTFSDDDGNAESRTSAAYPSGTVGDSNAPTGADKTVTLAEDGSYAFKAADFGFADSDTGDALSSVKVATLSASGKGTLALDGTTAYTMTAGQSVTKADLDAGEGHGARPWRPLRHVHLQGERRHSGERLRRRDATRRRERRRSRGRRGWADAHASPPTPTVWARGHAGAGRRRRSASHGPGHRRRRTSAS